MALETFQYIFNGARLTRVTGASESIGRIEAISGTIKSISVRAENVGAVGNFVFNVRKNGTALLSGANRLTVNTGAKRAEKTDADFSAITTIKGDLLSFALDEIGAGGILGDLIFTVIIDDGITPAIDTEAVQDLVAAMFISGSHTSWTYNDAAGTLKVDAVQLTDEEIQDKVGAFIGGGANTTVTYNDGANTLTIAETTAGKTQEEIEDIVAGLLHQGSNITLTYNDSGNSLTIAASGGGGGSSAAVDNLFSIDAKPNSDIHPLSDYFDSEADTLANSTAFQGANHRFLVDGGRAKIIMPSTASEISTGRFKELPPGDCVIIAKIWNVAEKINYASVGICLFQDAAASPNTSDYISLRLEKLATDYRAAIAYYTNYATPSAYIGTQPSLNSQTQVPVYLKFSRTAGVWSAYYSENGKVFNTVGSPFNESSYFVPKEFGLIAVNNTHGNTNVFDIEFIYFYDSAAAVLPGGGIKQITSAISQRIICLGDSITQGYGAYEIDSYPNQLADFQSAVAVGYDGNVFRSDDGVRTKKVINKGYNGYTAQNIIDNMVRNTLLRRNSSLTRDIVILFVGTNDIGVGQSASAIYTKITSIVSSLKTVGFQVYVCTIIDRNDVSGFDTVRASLNSAITGNAAAASGVIDLFDDSRLADASNATYFQSDQLHPNAAGLGVIASIINSAL